MVHQDGRYHNPDDYFSVHCLHTYIHVVNIQTLGTLCSIAYHEAQLGPTVDGGTIQPHVGGERGVSFDDEGADCIDLCGVCGAVGDNLYHFGGF